MIAAYWGTFVFALTHVQLLIPVGAGAVLGYVLWRSRS